MPVFSVGPLRFEVEHRNPGAGGGPTLRVRDEHDREWLRFDCFERARTGTAIPTVATRSLSLRATRRPLAWTLAGCAAISPGCSRAPSRPNRAPSRELAAALDAVELALRNPPTALDEVRPSSRRPSRGEKWTTYPDDVLPLWWGTWTSRLRSRSAACCASPSSARTWATDPSAPTDIPDLTVERMARLHGWSVAPGRVEILSDVVQGMYTAIHQFSRPGDGVVVQTPIYPPFLGSVGKLRRRLDENPLVQGSSGYTIDLERLRSLSDDATRIFLLCNPHNPTGRVFRRVELEALAQLALERDWWGCQTRSIRISSGAGTGNIPFASLGPEVEARTDHTDGGVEGIQHRRAALPGRDLWLR